jgi:hypothetical protein
MSTQVYSSHQQTRQQLDELDALLQRMMNLPLHAAESARPNVEAPSAETFAPLPPTLPRADVAPATMPSWRLAAPVLAGEPPMAVPIDEPQATALAEAPAPYPYSLVFGQPLPTEAPPAALVEPPPQPSYARPSPLAEAAPIWAIPAENKPAFSLFALPFVAINRLFDLPTYLLGPLGACLRHPVGKTILGWLGIAMLLGAIGWAAHDWRAADWAR